MNIYTSLESAKAADAGSRRAIEQATALDEQGTPWRLYVTEGDCCYVRRMAQGKRGRFPHVLSTYDTVRCGTLDNFRPGDERVIGSSGHWVLICDDSDLRGTPEVPAWLCQLYAKAEKK